VSIRLRLAAWYAGSVLALFLLTGLLLRVSLHQILLREHERGADRSAEVAHGVFRAEVAEYRTVRMTVAHIGAELVIPDQELEFVEPGGRVFARVSPPALRDGGVLAPPVYLVERPLDAELAPGWTVRVRASMAPLERSLRRIDRSLLLIIPLTVILASLTGWWLTGRTLRPVGEMAAAAEAITPATPGARVPVANPRDELGRLALRINDLLGRLESALAQQRRFLADAAHELRTPMARLLSQAEVGLSPRAAPDDREQALHLIHDDLERTSSVIGELLQLARVDAGEPAPPMEPGYLDDAVAAGIQPWYAVAERRGLALHLAALDEAPARLNGGLIARLLGVLLDNAMRYTPPGGRVEVSVAETGGGAVLEVRDTGIGIPAGDREHLFERFFRGRAARDAAPEGSGLGLPIAQWIVRQHGGTLEITSPPEGGTLVRVTLPPPPPERS
jgi:signal transduction histidine kinase